MTMIGVDLGGTNILAAAVDEGGTASGHVKRPTPTGGPEAVAAAIVAAVTDVGTAPTAVGIGVPGPVAEGVLLTAPNLVGFHGPVDLRAMVGGALGVDVVVANDADVGTLGEARHGAARGARGDVLGCWLGTGVGGGLVLGGRLRTGVSGVSGELGHVPVEITDPRRCACGRLGCVEAYAGRASMEAQARAAIDAGERSSLLEVMAAKGRSRMTSGVWRAALRDGDPLAERLVEQAVVAVGAALAGVLNVVDVESVVLGGGLATKLGQPLVDRVAAATIPRLMAPDAPRRWLLAELGDDAGVVGAAALAGS